MGSNIDATCKKCNILEFRVIYHFGCFDNEQYWSVRDI